MIKVLSYLLQLLREGESKNMCYELAGIWKPRLTENASNVICSSIPCDTSNDPPQIASKIGGLITQDKLQQHATAGINKSASNEKRVDTYSF